MKGVLGGAADEARIAQSIYENFKIGTFSGFAAALDDAQLETIKKDSRPNEDLLRVSLLLFSRCNLPQSAA